MNLATKIHLGIYFSSLGSSLGAVSFDQPALATWLVLPAVVQSGLVTLGHVITLDDDYPGEWSNPGGSRAVWYASLRELALKLAFLLVAVTVFVWMLAKG